MFLVSLKSLKGKFILLITAIAAAVILCVIFSGSEQKENYIPTDTVMDYSASNDRERIAFLKQLGYTVRAEPDSINEVLIPSEFDDIYEQYNNLQKQSELDLEPYKGCTVKKWTYTITNYPEYTEKECIKANLLIYKGKVIGGDICNVELDGFMNPLCSAKQNNEPSL